MLTTPSWLPYNLPPSPGVFELSSYFPPNGSIRVQTTTDEFPVHHSHAIRLFPRLDVFMQYDTINVMMVAGDFDRHFKDYSYMEQSRIYRCLSDLFRDLRKSHDDTRYFKDLVMLRLENSLRVHHGYWSQRDGLSEARRRFVVLTYFAYKTRSSRLASVLAQFFIENQDYILPGEHPEYLGAWCLAYMTMRNLLHTDESDGILKALSRRFSDICATTRYFMDHRWGQFLRLMEDSLSIHGGTRYLDDRWASRGRRTTRPLLQWDDIPRARTMPPPIVPISPYLPPLRYSPSPSMELALRPPSTSYTDNEYINLIASNQLELINDGKRNENRLENHEDRIEALEEVLSPLVM